VPVQVRNTTFDLFDGSLNNGCWVLQSTKFSSGIIFPVSARTEVGFTFQKHVLDRPTPVVTLYTVTLIACRDALYSHINNHLFYRRAEHTSK